MSCLWIFNNNKKYNKIAIFFSKSRDINHREKKIHGHIQVSTSSVLHHSCPISKPVQQKKKKRTTFAVLFFTIDGKLVGYRYTKNSMIWHKKPDVDNRDLTEIMFGNVW